VGLLIIGRNGVGKTYLINNMIKALLDEKTQKSKVGYFESQDDSDELFANLVSVSFSAFDESEPIPEIKDRTAKLLYSYVGLKRESKDKRKILPPKSPTKLMNEFVLSAWHCQNGAKKERWYNSIKLLESDPIFLEADVTSLGSSNNEQEFKDNASALFKKFSSGHKIVLLTITRLVETVEERTLVLLDEPEAHLHPPLLSAFIRALSSLLIQRNGVGLIATHSPVILQEVPKNCVWKLRRNGDIVNAERPQIETFGENVGVLTYEVFGLEVTDSGYHQILKKAVDELQDYESIVNEFNKELGMEAKALIRVLLNNKKTVDSV
jgi:ATPase subunit of ABC transporter with duplicated ATPase domains